MSERVKPDGMMWTGDPPNERREPVALFSTVRRVLDEEGVFWDQHPNAEDVHPKYVIRAIRARFEEPNNDT